MPETVNDFDNSYTYKKGEEGEDFVYRMLDNNFDGIFIRNAIIETAVDESAEIDLIMIHKRGIFVFEIKNFGGFICGKPKEYNWTQVIGGQKNVIYNPIIQNNKHVNSLKKVINRTDVKIESVIAISDRCNIKQIEETDGVTFCNWSSLIPKIRESMRTFERYYSDEEKIEIADIIFKNAKFDEISRQKHIDFVNRLKEGHKTTEHRTGTYP